MTKDKRLGRGLAALLNGADDEDVASPDATSTGPQLYRTAPSDLDASQREADADGGIVTLGVHEIEANPFQPRREFGEAEIASLAESLREHQQLQPILVRSVGGRWQLISGERRLRAAIHAGLSHIKAQVRQADDRLVAELAIVENLQRKDLNAIEKALSFQRYIQEHGCTQEDLGQRLKIDRSTIANLLRLLELPAEVQDCLRSGTISAGHARALLPLGDEGAQLDFCQRIRRDGISVRDTERMVQETIAEQDSELLDGDTGRPRSAKARKNEQVAALEQEFRRALGTRVDLKAGSRGRGRIVIHFSSSEEFERLSEQLMGADFDDLSREAG